MKFIKDLLKGPKAWSEWHGIFIFLVFALPFSVVLAFKMTPSDEELKPRYAGLMVDVKKFINDGIVYSEIRSEHYSFLVKESFDVQEGDSLYIEVGNMGKPNGFLCVGATSHNCVRIMSNGVTPNNKKGI